MKYTVNVTQEDIEHTRQGGGRGNQIIQNAIRRVTDSDTNSNVSRGIVTISSPTKTGVIGTAYTLPVEVVSFIERIDAGKFVMPFTFTLNT